MYRPSITIETAGIIIPTRGTRILGSKFVASSLVITFKNKSIFSDFGLDGVQDFLFFISGI